MSDYAPRLDDEIALCNRCGERVHTIPTGNDPHGEPVTRAYCFKCGSDGRFGATAYVRKNLLWPDEIARLVDCSLLRTGDDV